MLKTCCKKGNMFSYIVSYTIAFMWNSLFFFIIWSTKVWLCQENYIMSMMKPRSVIYWSLAYIKKQNFGSLKCDTLPREGFYVDFLVPHDVVTNLVNCRMSRLTSESLFVFWHALKLRTVSRQRDRKFQISSWRLALKKCMWLLVVTAD